ncbi:MAG TPA: CHAD domain-containing protein [Acidimicrobiales bacterium]|nr:CHAD domain-containing protein [Acidimicrobiales bacterium]
MASGSSGPGLDLDGPNTLAVLSAAISEDLARLRRSEPIVLEGIDPEGIHQARVACRRLRSRLRTFAPALRPNKAERLAAELGWLGRRLGAVRDLDVLADRLRLDLEGLAGPLATAVLRRCRTDRQEAFDAARRALAGGRYLRLVAALGEAAAAPPLRRRAAGLPAAAVLLPELRRHWDDLEHEVVVLPPGPSDPQLHHVRILAKRARYAAEAASFLGSAEIERLAGRLAKLQKVLGELNDASKAVSWLEAAKREPWPSSLHGEGPPRVGDSPSWAPDTLVAVETALSAEHRSLAALRLRWPASYDRAVRAARELGWMPEEPIGWAPPGSPAPPP